jgi:hypothetical protein
VANLIVSAVSTFDNKGLKKGQKEISAFDKTLKTLGKTFLGVFGAQKLIQYGKNAVNAFMADEKAAKSLELQLKNTGYAFSAPAVEYYIANLQKTTGVLDDELRPAFQQLLTVTGSVTKSQDSLTTALNISAATGKSLTEVSAALTRGFSGNTTGLSRLGAGISKATLKTGDMDQIMAELNQKFAGQAAARLDTYAGKMDLLKAAAADANEIIGKGLLDSLSLLSTDNSIQTAADDMNTFATAVADATYGMALLIKKIDKFTGLDKVNTDVLMFLSVGLLPGALAKYGNAERNKPKSNFTYGLGPSATKDIERANKILKERNKLAQDELNKMKAKTAVDALKDKFDLERIGLTAALNAATDEETKLRLRAQLAILDNNEAMAKKLLAEMNAAEALKKLGEEADKAAQANKRASEGLATAFDMLSQAARNLMLSFGLSPSQVGPGGTNISKGGLADVRGLATTSLNNPNFGTSAEAMALGLSLGFTPGSSSSSSYTQPQEIVITVDTASGGDRLSQAIAESIQIATKNGFSTVPAGQGF